MLVHDFPLDVQAEDDITWKHANDGIYSAATVYKALFLGLTRGPHGLEGLGAPEGQILCLVSPPRPDLDRRSASEAWLGQLRPLSAMQERARNGTAPLLQVSLHA
jgi:hypothetical protein